MVIMLRGQNSKTVIERVKQALDGIRRSLPQGVSIVPFYDQSVVIDGTIRTVRYNLLQGGALVVAILFLFLGNLARGADCCGGDSAVHAGRVPGNAVVRHHRQSDEPGSDRLRRDRQWRGDHDRKPCVAPACAPEPPPAVDQGPESGPGALGGAPGFPAHPDGHRHHHRRLRSDPEFAGARRPHVSSHGRYRVRGAAGVAAAYPGGGAGGFPPVAGTQHQKSQRALYGPRAAGLRAHREPACWITGCL